MTVISIDIGGTSIKGAIITKEGKIIRKTKIFTQVEKGKTSILNRLLGMISILSKTIHKIDCVALSIPGYLDKKGNYIFTGDNLSCLKGVNLQKEIQSLVDLPVFIENDANCFAVAEANFGKYKNANSLFGFIWGTGIGGGIVIDRKLYSGSFNRAGEIGKIKLPVFISKNEKHIYTLEHMCSGKNIAKMYEQSTGESLMISKIMTSKNSHALKIQKIVINSMAWAFSTIIDTINPDVIVVGGGVSNVPSIIYSQIKKEMLNFCDKESINKTKIERYSISDDAGILGAAYLAHNSLKN
jgi:predicted NBD/HSP70 family sugar kinase